MLPVGDSLVSITLLVKKPSEDIVEPPARRPRSGPRAPTVYWFVVGGDWLHDPTISRSFVFLELIAGPKRYHKREKKLPKYLPAKSC